ncbi:MAG: TRAP transporter substrate-binding protein [Deltaproteobacteria bacterium]|nr:TRAP transporter substrate-binding protein [Deltaproteobacteria bacterium]
MLSNKSSFFKRLLSVFLVMTMVTIFGMLDAEAGKITLKFAHQNNTFDADQLLAETFKDLVEAKTDGEIKIKIFPGTLTNSEEEAIEFLKLGSVQIGATSAGHIAGYYPDVQFLKVARRSGVVNEILRKISKATGLIALGIYSDCNGFAIASTTPITKIEDAKGVKLRCMQNPLFVDIYKEFGFTVTPTDWGELYTSLQTGLVNANDLGVYCNYIFKMKEVVNSYAILNQMWTQKILFLSPKTWNKLDDTQRDIVKDAAESAIELADAWQYVREQEFIEKAKKDGFTITYPDTAPFKKASEKVYSKWFKKNPHWKVWYKDIQLLNPEERLPEAYQGKRD